MHTFGETGSGVPAFLAKLWRLVEDSETNHLIYWNTDGRSFIIQNQAQFARELLPLNYKHNNMASFIRQLNMYGFHKITSIDNGGLKFDRDEMEFSHPCFKRGHPHLLEHIKRKIATTKATIDEKGLMKPEAINKVLSEVKVMRGRQDSLDSRFSVMKQENEALWREIASLRQKHIRQQQIVNKLIQFLVTIVQPSSRNNVGGVKRRYQLMINDAPQSTKLKRNSESGSGPIVHELTEELLDEVNDSNDELMISSSPDFFSGETGNQLISDLENVSSPGESYELDGTKSNSNQSGEDNSPNQNMIHQKTIGPDGSIFHITEIPAENITDMETNQFIEENVLSTPMVKREMSRTQKEQLKKQKDKKPKLMQAGVSGQKKNLLNFGSGKGSGAIKKSTLKSSGTNINPYSIKIKSEKDIDSLLFMNCQNNSTLMPSLGRVQNQEIEGEISNVQNDTNEGLYVSDDFINSDVIPSDLFENSSIIDDMNLDTPSYDQNINLNDGGALTQVNVNIPIENGTNNNNKSDEIPVPSTATSMTSTATSMTSTATSMTSTLEGAAENDDDKSQNSESSLTLAKYNTSKFDEDIMRLSTPEEFTTHLDNVQEDLENLKDMLRTDGYSLDANTLLGNLPTTDNRLVLQSPVDGDILSKLFSDSDVLAPYGLSISEENNENKKESELMACQPYYSDLSDILTMNAENISTKAPNSSGGERSADAAEEAVKK